MTHHPIIPLILVGFLFPSLSFARPPGPPPPDPVAKALDRNHDHELSSREIKNAPRALLKLDEDRDDALSREELRPEPPRGEGRGPRDDGDQDRPPGPPPSPLREAIDRDGDGALSAAEIEEASESLLKLDADDDGQLSAREVGHGRRPPPPGEDRGQRR